MAFDFFKNLLDDNAKAIKKYQKVVDQINGLEPKYEKLTDAELQNCTNEFKERIGKGETLDQLLPEAFAVVREASKRVLGMRHFDVQLIGGMALHDGRISEMKTGEGKTLVATLPVYLNALLGKGVHVITVNDYLATRDAQWMGKLYNFLGLSVGLCVHGLTPLEKKANYACDITYGTNNEFGFDYLRDNMAVNVENMVQRPLYYAIVDEVDSILIDEARTPLIISGPSAKPTDLYYTVAKLIPQLKNEEDYSIDEKLRTVVLTEAGVTHVENALGVENLYEDKNTDLNHYVQQGLKAHVLFKKDRDYVVKDGQVIIVDEFTGRLMYGRRYNEGLHQSIEAKEGVKIERESQTLATITFQNYFRMYEKLAGMTGTAKTEEPELMSIYGLDVVVIPTNKPMARQDYPDAIFRTEQGKYNAVLDAIEECHKKGQPVLVGTISIERSEYISKLLKHRGIPHNVLNAKYHEIEAEIVAQAGRYGAVTIATNMAGRGTDILLGGNPDMMLKQYLAKHAGEEITEEKQKQLFEQFKAETLEEREKVREAGGLAILGTERHESRRIDNQLRGRAGRQGDVGFSRFYLSIEDDLMRRFGGDNLGAMMDKLGVDDSMPIENNMVSRSLEGAQKKVEARNFEIRKNVLQYDDVMNKQREVIYKQRMDVLRGENLRESVRGMITDTIELVCDKYKAQSPYPEEWDLQSFMQEIEVALPVIPFTEENIKLLSADEVAEQASEAALKYYEQREEKMGAELFREIERAVILRVVDSQWMDHIDAMDQLRQGIGLRAYGQKNPLIEYQNEAYNMFNDMIAEIKQEVARLILRLEVAERPEEKTNLTTNEATNEPQNKTVRNAGEKVGRNDPCPCGSGKKYKNCCGKDK